VIHARAPLRVSFSGGGTDHRKWYERYGGCVLSAAIKKYAHCVVAMSDKDTTVVWQGKVLPPAISMMYWTDLPPGSGLGGSSAVAVACIAAEDRRHGIERPRYSMTTAAEALERGHLRMAGGSQDYYPAVYGGCNLLEWKPNGGGCWLKTVDAGDLPKWLLLVRTGEQGDKTLAKQKDADIAEDTNVQAAMIEMMQLTKDMYQALVEREYEAFGKGLDEAWRLKKDTSPHCTTDKVERLITRAKRHGALGAKLCGVSASHLLLCAPPDALAGIKAALAPLACMDVEFDQEGLVVEGQL
jgi:D-glycero-alpha-D-manno-heptose-7-phosphate kinase